MKLIADKLQLNRLAAVIRRPMLLSAIVAAAVCQPLPAIAQAPSKVSAVQTEPSGPVVNVTGSIIEFSLGDRSQSMRFDVYSITGQLVKSVTVTSAPVRIELPKGFYIIKCESWTRRVMLK